MAGLTKCKDCGHEVSKQAASCPNCGAPIRKQSGNIGGGSVTLIGIVIFIIYVMAYEPITGSRPSRPAASVPSDGKVTFYAKSTVNIRRGPGTEHDVVDTLNEGQAWRCYPGETEGWIKCAEDEYIYASLLSRTAPPPLEIASWNWHSDSSFGVNGAVIWNAEIQNNTSRYIDSVRVVFSSYDSAGNLITTDFGYVQGLSPGGTASTTGYATYYGQEETGKLRVVP